ncbi:BPTI/Kunitz domain-containing protein [Sorangium sp. So ce131]|uniref:BPTI/Kunitz domain-containing protein n=1 Tax=Sorangium sp. So ce131 TaxID=3133282 RepID=UPI003F5F8052
MTIASATSRAGVLRRAASGLGLLAALSLAAGCYVTVNDGGSAGGDPGGGAGGSGAGGGGSGGGGALPARCTLPQVVGPCEAAFPRYWHDPSTGVCMPFIYGGCEGNANNFESLEACQEACHGGSPDMDACEAPSDCVLAATDTCSPCDPVEARSFAAVNRAMKQQYDDAIGHSDAVCEACPEIVEAERTAQYFTATCERGRCVVLDVRTSPLTECSEDADCRLRDGVGCCEGCDGRGIAALNRSVDLEALVCSPDFGACPACAPQYPEGMRAVCSAGRCQPQAGAAP